jgi:hypothetical protein
LDRKDIEPGFIQEVADDLHLTNSGTRSINVRREFPIRTDGRGTGRIEVVKPQPAQTIKTGRTNTGVESLHSVSGAVPESFLVSLREALVDAMGPMGFVVMSEQMKLFGATMDRFPRDKIGTLIESVSREIFDEAMRESFRRTIYNGFNIARKA